MDTHLCVDVTVLDHLSLFALNREYEALLTRLHVCDWNIEPPELWQLLQDSASVLVCLVRGDQLVATALGSVCGFPDCRVLVDNVVTHDDYEGRGYGKQVLEELENEARRRWSHPQRHLRAILTNRPTRGNGEFYARQGWYPLTPDTVEMTRLWQKDL